MIRKLTLEEWFLKYQLDYIDKKYNHLNAFVNVDITKLLNHFKDKSRIPMTALLVKACGIWQKSAPEINRQIFSTIFGQRMYSCDSLSVNLPIILDNNGSPYVSIAQIDNANELGLESIKIKIKEYLKSRPQDLPVGKILVNKKNTFFNRTRLKFMHFIVNNFPKLQQKYNVGTISVSSLLNLDHEGSDVTFMAKGPGAISICVCGFDRQAKTMRLGIAWDHGTGHGFEGVGAAHKLTSILEGKNDEVFKELIRA